MQVPTFSKMLGYISCARSVADHIPTYLHSSLITREVEQLVCCYSSADSQTVTIRYSLLSSTWQLT